MEETPPSLSTGLPKSGDRCLQVWPTCSASHGPQARPESQARIASSVSLLGMGNPPPPLQCDQSKLAAGLRFVHEASPLHSLESFFCWHSKAAAHLRTPGGWSWHHLPGKDLSSSARFSSALCEALCRMSAVPENLVPVQGVRALDTDELTPLWLPPVPASIMESPSPLPPDHLLPPASGRAEWFPLIPYNLSP